MYPMNKGRSNYGLPLETTTANKSSRRMHEAEEVVKEKIDDAQQGLNSELFSRKNERTEYCEW